MSALQLRIVTSAQNIEIHALDEFLLLPVEPGATYSLVDSVTQEPVGNLVLKKKDDALVVEVDGEPVAQLEQFYDADQGAVFEVSEAGNVKQVTAADPVAEGSDVVWQAADSSDLDPATVFLGGAGFLGGALIAQSSRGGGHDEDAPEANTVVGQIVAGPVVPGNDLKVGVYQADGITELGQSLVDAEGRFSVAVGSYRGVVIAQAMNTGASNDHLDEATNAPANLNAELFAVGTITEANSTLTLNLNALTTIAYHKAMEAAGSDPLQADDVSAINKAIANAFGLSDLHELSVVTVNGDTSFDTSDGISESEAYGILLAAFSGADLDSGGDSQATIDALIAGIDLSGGVATLSPAAEAILLIGAIVAGQTGDAVADLFGEGTGVTGVTPENAGSVKDALASLPKSNSDTPEEIQAIVDALNVVRGAAGGGTAPTLEDFETLGITGVTPETLKAMQEAVGGTPDDGSEVDTLAGLQAVIDSVDVTPPGILSVSVEDGTWKVGDQVEITITADNGETGLTLSKGRFNGQELTGFRDNGDGTYTAIYTVAEGDSNVADTEAVAAELTLKDTAGNTSSELTSVTLNGESIDASTPTILSVEVEGGSHKAGDDVTVTITAGGGETGLTLAPATFNGQELKNITDNGDGTYTGTYTVTNGDAEVGDGDTITTNLVLTDDAGNPSTTTTSVVVSGASIDTTAPAITDVSVADGTYGIGDEVEVTITAANQDSGLTLTSASFNGQTLTGFTDNNDGTYTAIYTVMEGDPDIADGGAVVADLVLTDAAGNVSNAQTTVTLNGERIDAHIPTVTGVGITSATGGQNGTLNAGDVLSVTVILDEAASVTGSPIIALNIGGSNVQATYISGSGSNELVFEYTVKAGDSDADGISIAANSLNLNGGTLTDLAGNAAVITHDAVAVDSRYKIDTAVPEITSVSVADGTYAIGDTVAITLTAANAETGLSLTSAQFNGQPLSNITDNGDGTYTGTYTVTEGDADIADGGSVTANLVLSDAAGNTSEPVTSVTLAGESIDANSPSIAAVSVADGNWGIGDAMAVTVTASNNEADLTLSSAQFNGQTLSNIIDNGDGTYTGTYTVTEGDADIADGGGVTANLVLSDAAGNTSELVTSVTLAGESIDANSPGIAGIAITGADDAQNDTLNAGDVVRVTVTMDDAVTVTGAPQLALNIGGASVQATYASGTGTNELVFEYTIQSNQTDVDGISIDANSLDLNGGSLADAAGNAAVIGHGAVADNGGYRVDTTVPTVTSVAFSGATGAQNDTLNAGDVLSVTVTLNEATSVTGTPTIALNIGGTTVQASYAAGSGSNELVFQYTIEAGQIDSDGISIDANSLSLNSGTLTDLAGNAAVITHDAVADNAGYKVDTTAPTIDSVSVADGAYKVGDTVAVTLTAANAEAGLSLSSTQFNGQTLSNITDNGDGTYTGTYTVTEGDADIADGGGVATNLVLSDAAGNASNSITSVTLNGESIDANSPAVTGVAITGATDAQNGTLNAGDVLSVTVTLSEAVTINTASGTPSIALNIGGTSVQATYVSGSGSNSLVFEYAILAGQNDADGVSINADSLALNGASLTDAAGNTALITHDAVADNAAYKVDTAAPAIAAVPGKQITHTESAFSQIVNVSSDGAYVVTWRGRDTDGDYSVFVQRFNADDTKSGDLVKLEAIGNTAGNDYQPLITALDGGAYAVHWTGQLSEGGMGSFVQHFNADGTVAGGGPVQVMEHSSNPGSHAISTVGESGAYAVGGTSAGTGAWVQLVNADGTLTGNDRVSLSGGPGYEIKPGSLDMTALGSDGSYVVTWSAVKNGDDWQGKSIFVQRFDAVGVPIGETIRLYGDENLTRVNELSKVTAFGSEGAFFVTWMAYDIARTVPEAIYVQLFNADGTTLGNDLIELHATVTDDTYKFPSITAVGGGEYVLSFLGQEPGKAHSGVLVQHIAADGTLKGDGPVSLSDDSLGSARDLEIAPIGSEGAYVATWAQRGGDNQLSVYAQLINADGTRAGTAPVRLEVPSPASGHYYGSKIAVTGDDGAFVITWFGGPYGKEQVFVQSFNPDGTPAAPIIYVNATGDLASAMVTVQSSEPGKAYLVDASITVASEADIVGLGSDLWSWATVDSANTDVTLSGAGLREGDYVVYTADAAGNLSAASPVRLAIDTVLPEASVAAAQIAPGASAVVQSTEPGTAYLVHSSVTVNSLTDITGAADEHWNSVAINAANTATNLAATGLADGDYRVYTTDAAGNLSTASADTVTVATPTVDTSIVVFDMVNGVNSDHSGRVFDANTSYEIYLHVDSDTATLFTTPQNGANANATWAQWTGADNLGSDDMVILVGNSEDVKGFRNGVVNDAYPFEYGGPGGPGGPGGSTPIQRAYEYRSSSAVLRMNDDGVVDRYADRNSSNIDLWSGTWAANPNVGKTLNQVYLTQMPVNILTSQGLV